MIVIDLVDASSSSQEKVIIFLRVPVIIIDRAALFPTHENQYFQCLSQHHDHLFEIMHANLLTHYFSNPYGNLKWFVRSNITGTNVSINQVRGERNSDSSVLNSNKDGNKYLGTMRHLDSDLVKSIWILTPKLVTAQCEVVI